MSSIITISLNVEQRAYLKEKGISPSSLFQKVLNQMIYSNSDKWFNEIELVEKEANSWKERYFIIKKTLEDNNKELAEVRSQV